jgi:GntR family transcriptional regulator
VHRHDRLQALAETLEDGHRRVVIDVREVGLQRAVGPVAQRLEVADGTEVVFLERCLHLDGAPLSVWSSYLPADVAGGLLHSDLHTDFYELMERQLRIELTSAEFLTEARLADELIAELLVVPPGSPVLFLERLVRGRSGAPVEFGFVFLRGDRIQFASSIDRRVGLQ